MGTRYVYASDQIIQAVRIDIWLQGACGHGYRIIRLHIGFYCERTMVCRARCESEVEGGDLDSSEAD